jgi:exodeoxyribonuclease V gamma subunit
LDLGELVRFWKDPARGFLARLRVGLDDDIREFEDRETVSLDGLGRYQRGDDLLQRMERGLPVVREVELGRGGFPLGAAGEVELAKVGAAAVRLRVEGERLAPATDLRWVDVDVELPISASESDVPGTVRLLGRLAVRGDVLLEIGFQRASARAQLGTWIRHLALCAAGAGQRTILLARPAARFSKGKASDEPTTIVFGALSPNLAREQLALLVRGYLSGQTAPLCFSPEASLALVRTVEKAAQKVASGDLDIEEVRAQARQSAQKALEGYEAGDFVEVFRDEDPRVGLSPARAAELERRSYEVFGPLLAQQLEAEA